VVFISFDLAFLFSFSFGSPVGFICSEFIGFLLSSLSTSFCLKIFLVFLCSVKLIFSRSVDSYSSLICASHFSSNCASCSGCKFIPITIIFISVFAQVTCSFHHNSFQLFFRCEKPRYLQFECF